MVLRVNAMHSSSDGSSPRVQQNLVITDLDKWSPFASGTGILPTYSGISKDTATFTKTAGSGRSWLGSSVDVVAGQSYAFGCFVDSRDATLSTNNIYSNATISAGSTSIKDNNANRWWCIKFTAAATETVIVRIGMGPGGDETGSVTSLVMSKPFCFELAAIDAPIPEYVAGWQDMGSSVTPSAAFSHAPGGYLTADAGGQITYTSTDAIALKVPLTPKPYSVGLFVGDSFSNDDNEWPYALAALDSNLLLLGNGTAGAALNDYETVFADLIALDGLDYTGDVLPEFIVIQGSINSPNESFTVAQMLASYKAMIDASKAAGIYPIVTNICPYGQSSSYDTNTEGALLSALNQRLEAFAKTNGAGFVDIFSAVVDTDGYSMKAEYVSGDTLHPNESGSIAIASSILKVVRQLRSGASGGGGIVSSIVR